jgi:hypothetical protein
MGDSFCFGPCFYGYFEHFQDMGIWGLNRNDVKEKSKAIIPREDIQSPIKGERLDMRFMVYDFKEKYDVIWLFEKQYQNFKLFVLKSTFNGAKNVRIAEDS